MTVLKSAGISTYVEVGAAAATGAAAAAYGAG